MFAARLDAGTLAPADAVDQFRLAYFEGLFAAVRKAGETKPEWKELVSFAGPLHDRAVAEFKKFDQARIAVARDEVRRTHYGRVREGQMIVGPYPPRETPAEAKSAAASPAATDRVAQTDAAGGERGSD